MKKHKRFGTVHETTDYELFTLVMGNRVINDSHLKRLRESMMERHLVSPILVNDNYEIIDGQHRFTVCKQLGLPVRFIVVDGYGLDEVRLLNANSSNWSKKAYLDSYCVLGYPEYIKMRKFMRQYPQFSITIAETLLKGRDVKSGKQSHDFYSGKFKVEGWKSACAAADKILMVEPYYDGFMRRSFILAMLDMFNNPNYNHADFLNKLSYQSVALQNCSTESQYKVLIEEIYNYRRRDKVNLRFNENKPLKVA